MIKTEAQSQCQIFYECPYGKVRKVTITTASRVAFKYSKMAHCNNRGKKPKLLAHGS